MKDIKDYKIGDRVWGYAPGAGDITGTVDQIDELGPHQRLRIHRDGDPVGAYKWWINDNSVEEAQ